MHKHSKLHVMMYKQSYHFDGDPLYRPRDRYTPIKAQMDWKVWENRRAGGAKLSLEEAERYVSEVILSRSIVAPPWSESEGYFGLVFTYICYHSLHCNAHI